VKRAFLKSSVFQRHRTAKEKAEILREHQRSGLSLLAFARKEGLCYASLLRWRAGPRKGASLLVAPEAGSNPRFVPVQIESEEMSGDYVLSWAGGRSLKIPLQFETDSLRRLLAVLEGVR
jgi:transposase-like protein